MPIDLPQSDISRSIQHNPEESWPESVQIRVCWNDSLGRPVFRTELISADQFFGRGSHGAPLEGAYLVNLIERMRREGPPKVIRGPKGKEQRNKSK